MPQGYVLNIDDSFLNKLNDADARIAKLAATSQETQSKVIASFQAMAAQGVDEFIKKLKDAKSQLTQLGNIQGGGNKVNIKIQGLDVVGNQTTTAIESINKLIDTLNNLRQVGGQQFLGGVNNLARQTLRDMNKEANRMKKTFDSLDESIKNYGISASDLAKKLAEARKAQSDFNNVAKQQAQSDVQGLIGMKGQQKTLNELKNYANELKRTMANLDPNSQEWRQLNEIYKETNREIKKINNSMKDMHEKSKGLMAQLNKFRQLIALVFSVSRITNFANKLLEVRKEFELQQRSLEALLQNKDEADKLWQRTIDLAVKSPYTVKELVTYTKQLAAYRIESEKLYDTNKMLADISSGLGVDMQRLILAFGQVKAANYLRGTELRQFSEAGVNILGELAKYFSELENRAISVGDVFERVSKRMVSFSDVEEVLKRLTSEGGTFYRMQEIQSETLRGLLSNLQDTIDLMLNDIGKANDSTLKNMVLSVKSVVENWREIAFVLEKVIKFMTLSKLASLAMANGLRKAGDAALWGSKQFATLNGLTLQNSMQVKALGSGWTKFINILKVGGIRTLGAIQSSIYGIGYALKSLIPILAIGVFLELWRRMTKASRAAKELKKSLQEIFNQDNTSLESQIDGYKNLVTRLEEANKGTKARADIIAKLNSQYGEHLNFIVDEETAIDNLRQAYDGVIASMKEKQSLATFEKGMEAIAKSYGESLNDAKDAFYDLFSGASIKSTKSNLSYIVPTKKEIDDIYAIIQQRSRELNAEQLDDLSEQSKLVQEVVKNYYGEEFSLVRDYGKSIELLDILVDKKKQELELQKDINALYGQTLHSREANLALEQLQNKYAEKRREIESSGKSKFDINKQLNELITQEKLDVIDLKVKFNIIEPEAGEAQKQKIINWATNITKSINDTIQSELGEMFSEEDLSKVFITQGMQESQSVGEYLKGIESSWERQNSIIAEQISLKSEGHTIDETILNNAIRLEELYRKVAKLLGIELKYEERINEETRKSINDQLPLEYQISLEESLKSQTALLDEANKKKEEAIKYQEMLNASQAQGVVISSEQLAKASEDVKYWEKRWELLGGTKKNKGGDRTNSLYDERIKVIDDMNKKYKELNKTLSKSESMQGAFSAYIDAFAKAFEGIEWIPKNVKNMTPQQFASQVLNFPNENDLVRFLDKLAKEPMKAFEQIKVELAKGDYVYDIKVRTKIEEDERLINQIEEMFSGYELSLELQKLNIPENLAKGLFNIDTLSLPELRENILKLKPQFEGEDMLKEWDKILKRIDNMEVKAQEERLKTYTKYLVKAQNERVKLKLEELRQLAEVESEDKYSKDQKKQIQNAIRKETKEKLSKQEWTEFTGSDMYIQMFEDLEYLGDKAITNLKDKLEQLKTSLKDLPASDVKEIVTQIEKLESIQIKRSPFEAYRKTLAEIRALEKQGESEEQLQSKNIALYEANEFAQEELNTINTIISAREQGNTQLLYQGEFLAQNAELLGKSNDELISERDNLQNVIKANNNEAKSIKKKLKLYADNRESLQAMADEYSKIEEYGNKAFSGITSMLESIGVESDSVAMSLVDAGQQSFNLILSIIQMQIQFKAMGIAANSALGIIGWMAMALQGIAILFSTIFGMKDKRLEKQIERETKLVENLEKTYKNLEKAIENAYSINTFESANDMAQSNLKARIAATERMIKLEEDKKKTDKDRIEEWKDDIAEMRELLRELDIERIQELGGFGSGDAYKSAAQEFVSAWMDAYKEAGDGLSGLNEQFQEFFEDMVAKQVMMRGIEKFLSPFYEQFDAMFGEGSLGGGLATREELNAIKEMWAKTSPQLNDFLSGLMDSLGIASDLTSGATELSGLQKGIQGITEEQADVIAAYLNSMRFFVSDSNSKLTILVNSFTNSETPNPILSELRTQSEMIRAIKDMFSSVIGRGNSTHSGAYLKVAL